MLKKHAKMFNIGIDKHSTIPAKAGIQEVFVLQTNKKKPGSPIKLGMTVGVFFGDDIYF